MRHIVSGGILLAATLSSHALSVGQIRGAVLIGQPLDVSVPVTVEAGDPGGGAPCVSAEVFQGETRVDASRVQVSTSGQGTKDTQVRIRSSVLVNEPIVTVHLKAGCEQNISRKFELLADMVNEPEQGRTVPRFGPSQGATGISGAAWQDGSVVRLPLERLTPDYRSRRLADPSALAPGRAARKPASVVRRPAADFTSSESRLKLEPLDLLMERDPVLRTSISLLTPVEENSAKRADAAAMWRIINSTPEDILRDARLVQSLQTDMGALKASNQKSQTTIKELRTKLEKAEGAKYNNPLIWALAALLAALLAGVGYLWHRSRSASSGEWWRSGASPSTDKRRSTTIKHAHTTRVEPASMAESAQTGGKPETVGEYQRRPAGVAAGTAVAGLAAAVAAKAASAKASSSDDESEFSQLGDIGVAGRSVNAEELYDVQQQADFFVSLGQFDQAEKVLRDHISDNVETSALAYLDLMKIYRLQNKQQAYEEVRSEFNQIFNARAPEFEAKEDQTRGLDSYPSVLSEIEELWPSPEVLDLIEDHLFRKGDSSHQELIDLDAYRELLMLHAIAKEIVTAQGGPHTLQGTPSELRAQRMERLHRLVPGTLSTAGPATVPLPMVADHLQDGSSPPASFSDSLPMHMKVQPSGKLGLDIDLDEIESVEMHEDPVDESMAPTRIQGLEETLDVELDSGAAAASTAEMPESKEPAAVKTGEEVNLMDLELESVKVVPAANGDKDQPAAPSQ